jgi:serine/threonine protein kinase
LLVGEHWNVKICDFGLSRLKQVGTTLTACGTPCWTAPEVLRNEHYSEKADVYSFAIVVWECLTREDPFAGMPPFHVVFVVGTQNARPEVENMLFLSLIICLFFFS